MLFIFTLIFTFNEFGILKKNQILVRTSATTGSDLKVITGRVKLYFQTKKFNKKMNYSGVMLSELNQPFYEFLKTNDKIYSNGDYLLIKYETVGTKQSDNPEYHPLIKINSWKIVSYLKFWSLIILETLFLIYLIRKMKFKKLTE